VDLLQFSSAGSIDFTAFDVVETHSAKFWLGAWKRNVMNIQANWDFVVLCVLK
jgi:hypothetical protein